jgi:hypothetical protein
MDVGEVLVTIQAVLVNKAVDIYAPLNGVFTNIQKLPGDSKLEDLLIEGQQFQATTKVFDGSLNVTYSFEGVSKSEKFQKNDRLKAVFERFEIIFGVKASAYVWIFGWKEYRPAVDGETELIELSDEAQLLFEVSEPLEEKFRVELLLIDDDYERTRRKTTLVVDFPMRPTFEDVVAKAKEFRSTFKVFHVYKVNSFEEPVKEINPKGHKEMSFDGENVGKLMIKETPGKLDFQSLKFAVYTPLSFPVDLNKQLDLRIEDEMTVGAFKTLVMEKLAAVFPDSDSQKYHFQFLNQFNVPSKYLLQRHSQLKKHCNSSNKLLVRRKDCELPPNEDFVAVFCRKRNTEQRYYEGYQQVFLPRSLQKVTATNLAALKELLVTKLKLDCPFTALSLAVVNYRNFEWKKIEKGGVNLKDGDEIGYLVRNEGNAYDDMQSDELLALALADNRDRYVFNHKFVKETPYMINLDE